MKDEQLKEFRELAEKIMEGELNGLPTGTPPKTKRHKIEIAVICMLDILGAIEAGIREKL